MRTTASQGREPPLSTPAVVDLVTPVGQAWDLFDNLQVLTITHGSFCPGCGLTRARVGEDESARLLGGVKLPKFVYFMICTVCAMYKFKLPGS